MDKVKRWIEEIVPYSNWEKYVLINASKPNGVTYDLFTNNYIYSISINYKSNYLGCGMSCRKPRAGEDWTRGSDLPDGKIVRETWNAIKDRIISNEIVKLDIQYTEPLPDDEGEDKKNNVSITT